MLRKILYWLDNNAEKTVIVISYSVMAGIVSVEVIRRFVFKQQVPWSTSIPVYMFLFVAWFGAAYNVKTRSHLAFGELRSRLSYAKQFAMQIVDAICWYIFGVIVIIYSTQQVYIAFENSAIVYGTDDVMLWYFFVATPLSWSLILVRATQNLLEDCRKFRLGQPFGEARDCDS